MGKSIFIAEKPSVARQFADALKIKTTSRDGYIEGENTIITWCVGHLVTMSYPDAYDMKYKRWSMDTLPFLPVDYKYEVIDSAAKQFKIVSSLLKRDDVDTVYVCTDSGREGEYIYRLVEQESGVLKANRKRVWIDSQTEDEIKRGIKEAKDLSEYDNLAASAYLRAKEDYLMGINFSRALTLRYGYDMASFVEKEKKSTVISVGRVMTCVLGMVVEREREIRNFVENPFYRVLATAFPDASNMEVNFDCEWKAVNGSAYEGSPKLYKENGFKTEEDALALIEDIKEKSSINPKVLGTIDEIEKKKEKKNAPLLYNLAELQNDCSKLFKISPEETLRVIQELYEKKMVTYPRTDARVLSSAVAKEIHKNISGLLNFPLVSEYVQEILDGDSYKSIAKTKYTDDKKITDHYAVIPTGQGIGTYNSLSPLSQKIYEIIVRRFLAIFYGPAVYQKMNLKINTEAGERFFAGFKVMTEEGYLKVTKYSFSKEKKKEKSDMEENEEEQGVNPALLNALKQLKKGSEITLDDLRTKEGKTSPPKRYTSGSMILAMENAGQLIEDEELRAQIKGSGIGTSATRGGILDKLFKIEYLKNNKKTQIITPAIKGEMVYEVVKSSLPLMLDPKYTASWEKGLTMVVEGEVSEDDYMTKLNGYVSKRIESIKQHNNSYNLRNIYKKIQSYYVK